MTAPSTSVARAAGGTLAAPIAVSYVRNDAQPIRIVVGVFKAAGIVYQYAIRPTS